MLLLVKLYKAYSVSSAKQNYSLKLVLLLLPVAGSDCIRVDLSSQKSLGLGIFSRARGIDCLVITFIVVNGQYKHSKNFFEALMRPKC